MDERSNNDIIIRRA